MGSTMKNWTKDVLLTAWWGILFASPMIVVSIGVIYR